MKLVPGARGTDAAQERVPEAVPAPPVPAFVHVTRETPTASEAVPARARGVEDAPHVAPPVGDVIAIAGATPSAGAA